jgi:hypothetical protein
LRGSKGHSRFYPAERALYSNLYALPRKGLPISLHVGSNTIVLLQLAGFTSLRVVPKTFVRKEQLLSSTKDKFFATIDAHQDLVRVLVHLRFLPCSIAPETQITFTAILLSWRGVVKVPFAPRGER